MVPAIHWVPHMTSHNRNSMWLSALASLALLATGELSAQGSVPGSVLVFPLHRTSLEMVTIVHVTNTSLTPRTPQTHGGSTKVAFVYTNVVEDPSRPTRPLSCTGFCRTAYLTPGDTTAVLTMCHNVPIYGQQAGYLTVVSESTDGLNEPWSHNHLIGSSLHISGSGSAYALPALSYVSPVIEHSPTDINADGRLDFDGIEYVAAPDRLYVPSLIACLGSKLALIDLTGGPTDLHRVLLSIWNDNEYPLSATFQFSCWFESPLSSLSPLFSEQFLASLPNDSADLDINCDGRNDLETCWMRIDSGGVARADNTPITNDGALIGALTGGPFDKLLFGTLLWESRETQVNGSLGR